jgi:HK97 family phage major capsid protein
MDIAKLREQHKDLVARARTLQLTADDAQRELSIEEARDFEDLIGQAEQLAERMVREETLVAHEEGARTSFRQPTRPTPAGETRTAGEPQRFRSFGEQLLAVARAAEPGSRIDPRLLEQRAATGLNESVGTDGGFLVQQDFASEVWRRVYQTGEVLRRCRRIPISARSNSLKIPAIAETSRATGSRYGGVQAYWLGEADTKTASRPAFRYIELNLNKVAGLAYATDELLDDAPALEAIISEALTNEIQFLVEDAIINGDGAGKPLGILNSGAVVTQAQAGGQTATFTVANAAAMYGRLWAPSMANAVWLMNQDVYQQILQLSAANTLAFIEPGRISDAPRGMLLGRPIVPTEYNSTLGTLGDVILADLTQYVIADKGGIQSASSIHVQFLTDQTAFRFVYRVDGQPLWNSVLTPYKGTSTTSPFVTLATH